MGPICSTIVHSQIHLHYMCKTDSQSDQPFDHNFPVFWIVDPIKPPTMPPWGIVGLIVWAYIHSQMNLHMCTKFDANRTSRLTSSPDFLICDSLTPPPNVEGRIVFSLCPFPDESADVYQIWCQSGQSLDSLPILLDLWPLKTPRNAPLCLEVQLVWHISIPRWICTCVPNLVSIGPAVW